MVIEGNQIEGYRLCVLRSALQLEQMGLKSSTFNAYKTLKSMGYIGSKKEMLAQLDEWYKQWFKGYATTKLGGYND